MGCVLRLVVALATNALALWISSKLFGGVEIAGFWAYFIGSIVLGIANSIFKPLLTILTLPLVVLTLGLFYLLINIAMVAFTAWVTPNFSVHGFWDYVGTVFVIWVVNLGEGLLLDRSPPRTPRSSGQRGAGPERCGTPRARGERGQTARYASGWLVLPR